MKKAFQGEELAWKKALRKENARVLGDSEIAQRA